MFLAAATYISYRIVWRNLMAHRCAHSKTECEKRGIFRERKSRRISRGEEKKKRDLFNSWKIYHRSLRSENGPVEKSSAKDSNRGPANSRRRNQLFSKQESFSTESIRLSDTCSTLFFIANNLIIITTTNSGHYVDRAICDAATEGKKREDRSDARL